MTSQPTAAAAPATAIDASAPVIATADTRIDAPADIVWAVLATLDRWPSWNPGVKAMSIQGSVAPGTEFRWKAGPGTITSVLTQVDRPLFISWSGRTLGITARHCYELEAQGAHTCVRTAESFSGLASRIFRRSLARMVERTLSEGLSCLKLEAERRASA
jgi:hypothetical protein